MILTALGLTMISCEDLVEKGYRAEYGESDASFEVEALDYSSGAYGDMVSFILTVSSNQDIRSCVVQANYAGAGGSGHDVGTGGYDDPFVDHGYGTIQRGTRSFVVKYDYIIPDGINKSRLTFSLIDDMGKVSREVEISVVPPVREYPDVRLYALSNRSYDAFASINGLVYPDIRNNYSASNAESLDVQEKIDIIFYFDSDAGQSFICAPDDGNVSLELTVANATRFLKMEGISDEDFYSIKAASLVDLTRDDSIAYKGNTRVGGIMVGDIVGFSTDVNAVHSYKTGLIRVNSLHPTNAGHYPGTSYVMECVIISQIDE